MSESSSSDQLRTLHSSFSDIYADIETDILQKGQAVERFIQANQNNEKNSICFSYLQELFSFFKSEFMTNLSLRKLLIAQRELSQKNQEYKNDVQSFLHKFHQAFPNLCKDANSLEEIIHFSQKLFFQLDKYLSSNATKEIYQELVQQKRQLQQRNIELKHEYFSIQQREKLNVAEKQQVFQSLRISEEDLTDKFNSLVKEHSELEKTIQNLSDVESLQRKIKDVDKKTITIISNMTAMKAKFRRKIQKRKMKIDKYQVDIKELKDNRVEIEKELDSTQAKIDYLTNALAIPKDETIESPHEARFQIIELKKNYESIQKQINEDETSIQQTKSQIEDLDKYLYNTNLKISEKNKEIENLKKNYEKQQNVLQYIKKNQERITKINNELKISNETKRSLNFDKIKLNRKLEEISSEWKLLANNNNLLKKTETYLENQKKKAKQEIEESTLSDFDKEMFESVLDANRKLREELLLSINTTPKEISDIVIKQCNSI